MKVRITMAAEAAIDELDDWWRKQRPASSLAIALEIKCIIELLQDSPGIGARYDAENYPTIRRYRLRRTPYHLYYEVNDDAEELIIIALWSGMRSKRPPL